MITKDGDRCVTCGSEAPKWIESGDYDGLEDFSAACRNWEVIHEDCQYDENYDVDVDVDAE